MDPDYRRKKFFFEFFFKVFSEFNTLVLNEKNSKKNDILTNFGYRIAFLLMKCYSLMFSKAMEQQNKIKIFFEKSMDYPLLNFFKKVYFGFSMVWEKFFLNKFIEKVIRRFSE